jgi:membrane protease YdiL (CAAX protease family)
MPENGGGHPGRTEASTSEAVLITGLCFGWAIAVSSFIALSGFKGHGFTDARMAASIALELIVASLALFLLHRRGYWIGGLYPAPSIAGVLLGTALYVAAAFAGSMLAMPVAAMAAWNPVDRFLKGLHLSLEVVVPAAIVNGAYEEIFLLGFLQRTLRPHGASMALGIPLLVRVLYHTYQGPVGAVSVFGYGLIVGLFYLRTQALFPVVFAHILGDIVPFLLMGTVR